MKQSMKVALNQVSFYDRLLKLITTQRTHLKSVSVRRYPAEAVVTIESDDQFVLRDEPKDIRVWEKESYAGTADCELLTICISNSEKSLALELKRIISEYDGALTANGSTDFIITAKAGSEQIDELIGQILPFGITCMSRIALDSEDLQNQLPSGKKDDLESSQMVRSGG
ncbi:hypothetical protein [Sporolactobacillus laevolacticus]|uniref:Acetolactate synthase n=1 Tax=Sporolactobacillus laevolacticus DSM 442 TaxID=1395513 RepID=V6IZN4_9BACL|nr:hypothetical protein [Sporolactobacillus laevolacticus]EST12960.1 hypothetical protein P343_03990 [Sporolactobacillus laevolacticus DSM 442]